MKNSLHAIKAITNEAFSNFLQSGTRSNVSSAGDAYNKVPMVRRAVDLVADASSTVPVSVYDERGEKRDYDDIFLTPFSELMRRASMMIDIYGFCVIEKVRTANGRRVVDLRVLNSANISIMYVGRRDGATLIRFTQSDVNGESATFTNDDVIYIAEFNPADDVLPGKSRVQVAIEAARLMHYQTAYAASFFEKGAMNTLNVSVPPSMDEETRNRLKRMLNRLYSGIKNGVGQYMVLSNNIDVQVVSQPIKDLTVPELASYARREIAQALGVPQTMLEDTSNRASREQDTKTFWDTTIKMRVNTVSTGITRQFLHDLGMGLWADWQSLDVFQSDEAERSGSLLQLVTAGVPLPVALGILGYELSDDDMSTIHSGMLSPNERVLRSLPAQITGEVVVRSDEADEIEAWRNFSVKRFGKSHRDFEAHHIDETLQISIKNALKSALSVDDVHQIFDDASSYIVISHST